MGLGFALALLTVDNSRLKLLTRTIIFLPVVIAALIFMNKESAFTMPIMLVSVRTGRLGSVDWGALQAGVIVWVLPCILIYVLLQKYYVSGFLSGAVK